MKRDKQPDFEKLQELHTVATTVVYEKIVKPRHSLYKHPEKIHRIIHRGIIDARFHSETMAHLLEGTGTAADDLAVTAAFPHQEVVLPQEIDELLFEEPDYATMARPVVRWYVGMNPALQPDMSGNLFMDPQE